MKTLKGIHVEMLINSVVDTGDQNRNNAVGIFFLLTPVINSSPVSTTGGRISVSFINGVVDSSSKFMTGVADTGDKFITGVADTGDKFYDPCH